MTHRTPCWFRGLPSEGGKAQRKFRFLASLLLLLGLILLSAKVDLHAQPGPAQEIKGAELPKGGSPPPPVEVSTLQAQPAPAMVPPATPPLRFTIDPKSTLTELLPTPPKSARGAGPLLSNNLSRVPEVQFEAPPDVVHDEALKRLAHQIAKINHLNDKKTDGFMEALRSERPDLIGLPFAMGDACRTKGERSKQFALAVSMVRQALQLPATPSGPAPTALPAAPMSSTGAGPGAGGSGPITFGSGPVRSIQNGNTNILDLSLVASTQASATPAPPETFWEQYRNLCAQQDKSQAKARSEQCETITLARIAALTQILMPMTEMHSGLAKYLSTISHAETTRALARLALFSSEEAARKAAQGD